jgi:hypothetical protein
VGVGSVKSLEGGKADPRLSTLEAVAGALIKAGIELIEPGQTSAKGGYGVRLRR